MVSPAAASVYSEVVVPMSFTHTLSVLAGMSASSASSMAKEPYAGMNQVDVSMASSTARPMPLPTHILNSISASQP